jgi:hypothetical protein
MGLRAEGLCGAARSRQAMGVEFESLPANAHAEIQRYVQLTGSGET